MKLPRVRFTVRTIMVAIALMALALGGVLWSGRLQRQAAYYAFVAKAYEVEAKNHSSMIRFYREEAKKLKRPDIRRPGGYEDFTLFSNDWGGRLTTTRQHEWDPHASRPSDPDPAREEVKLLAQAERERARAAYFAALGTKYRRAASHPWLPAEPDPPPPP
jgi:hypothetical protein